MTCGAHLVQKSRRCHSLKKAKHKPWHRLMIVKMQILSVDLRVLGKTSIGALAVLFGV